MARDATADKASPAEHRDAAYVSIHLAILRDALDRPVERRPHGLGRLCRGATFVDMMRDHIDQNLRCGADRLPLLLSLIDERLGFSIQALRLFDHRLRPIEKIDQRLGRWQRFLNLPELCITETGNVTNEVNEPVVQHVRPCWWRHTNSRNSRMAPGRAPRMKKATTLGVRSRAGAAGDCCAAGFQFGVCRLRVKSDKAQIEQMLSALPPKADIASRRATAGHH